MGASYHQFCPVAKTMELLDERWTLLVVRELVAGSRHFNDLRRGLPQVRRSVDAVARLHSTRQKKAEMRSAGEKY